MFFWNKICGPGIIFFLFSFSSYAQSSLKCKENSIPQSIENSLNVDSSFFLKQSILLKNGLVAKEFLVPASFSTCQYGFFCRQEMVVEKKIKVPLRIRLGSLQQVNYYEGKR